MPPSSCSKMWQWYIHSAEKDGLRITGAGWFWVETLQSIAERAH